MTSFTNYSHLGFSPEDRAWLAEAEQRVDRYEREREQREQAAWVELEAQRRHEQQLGRLDRQAPVRQAGDLLVTRTTKGESVVLTLDQFRQHRLDVPPPPPLAAKSRVTARQAETLRAWVWQQPANKAARDWIAARCSYPSDLQGTCRHKAAYLRDHLGGRCIFGVRTDRRGCRPHAVLEIVISGKRLILDEDRTWSAAKAPFEPNPIPWLPRHLQPGYRPQRTAQSSSRSCADLQALRGQLTDLERRVGPGLRYRDVWHEGTQYHAGDVVTRSGLWIAQQTTTERPGEGTTAWRLAVRNGRDGRDSREYLEQKRMGTKAA